MRLFYATQNWHKKYPIRFRLLLAGAVIEKRQAGAERRVKRQAALR